MFKARLPAGMTKVEDDKDEIVSSIGGSSSGTYRVPMTVVQEDEQRGNAWKIVHSLLAVLSAWRPKMESQEQEIIAEFSPGHQTSLRPGIYDFHVRWKIGQDTYVGKLYDDGGKKYLEDTLTASKFRLADDCDPVGQIRKVDQLLECCFCSCSYWSWICRVSVEVRFIPSTGIPSWTTS
jgi:hypothetical protein